jgi:histidinol-phosphatase
MTAPTRQECRRFHQAALDLAARARRIVRRAVPGRLGVRRKPDRSLVTDVDLGVERALRAEITNRFPSHGIIGEELPPRLPTAAYQWILDPVDGTLSFVHGLPLFGTIVALHHHGRPVAGVIDHPMLGTTYSAGRGLGAWRNGTRLRIRDAARTDLGDEIVSAADRSRFVELGAGRAFDRLVRTHRHVRGYYDCVAHSWAAEGSIGAVVDYGVRLWDLAATRLLVEEAGGRYVVCATRGDGAEARYGIIAGKPNVVRWLVGIFGRRT